MTNAPPDPRTLADEWREFAALLLPPDSSDAQRVEMERAWYAGAASFLSLLADALDVGPKAAVLDLAYLAAFHQEIDAFAQRIVDGTA